MGRRNKETGLGNRSSGLRDKGTSRLGLVGEDNVDVGLNCDSGSRPGDISEVYPLRRGKEFESPLPFLYFIVGGERRIIGLETDEVNGVLGRSEPHDNCSERKENGEHDGEAKQHGRRERKRPAGDGGRVTPLPRTLYRSGEVCGWGFSTAIMRGPVGLRIACCISSHGDWVRQESAPK